MNFLILAFLAVLGLAAYVLGELEPPLWAGIAAYVFIIVWALVCAGVEHPPTWERLRGFASARQLSYYETMERIVRGLPQLLLPRSVEREPPPKTGIEARLDWWTTPRARDEPDRIALAADPWSWPVLDAALRIALVYPLFLALMQAALGAPGAPIGGYALIPEDTPRWLAAVATCVIAALIVSRILATATSKGVYEKLSMWLFLAAAAAAVAVAAAFAGAVAAAFAGVAVLSRATAAGARRGLAGYLVFTAALFAAAFTAALIAPADTPAPVWIVGLAVLPLVNAVFDWLSYGATMWLLGRAHRKGGGWRLAAGLADLGLAVILMGLLSAALVTVLALIDRLRADTLIDVSVLLTGLRAAPGESWWLIAMVASTLVPTLAHLGLALLSGTTWVRAELWNRLLDQLDKQHNVFTQFFGSLGFLLLAAAYLLVPAALLGGVIWLIHAHGGILIDGYVGVLLRYGTVIGLF